MNGSELYHHGILGQKWGVRRYQNDDGTWTIAGKERRRVMRKWDPRRFQNEDGSLTEEGKARYMDAARRGKLNYKKLSNADLDMINNRFTKEDIYKRNVDKAIANLPSTKIKKALLKVGEEAVKGALGAATETGGSLSGMLKSAFTLTPEKGGGAKGKSSSDSEETPVEEYWRKVRLGYIKPGLDQPKDVPRKRAYENPHTSFDESKSVSSLPDMSYPFASSLLDREKASRRKEQQDRFNAELDLMKEKRAREWEKEQTKLKAEKARSDALNKKVERGREYLLSQGWIGL